MDQEIQASDIVFALVTVDKEMFDEQVEFQRNLAAGRKIRQWKAPTTFTWQHNGKQYECAPGETARVPLAAAEHGVRESRVFRLDTDAAGNSLKTLDHRGPQYPMLSIVQRMAASEPGAAMPQVPASAAILCPFGCEKIEFADQGELREHLETKHQMTAAQEAPPKNKAEEAMAAAVNR